MTTFVTVTVVLPGAGTSLELGLGRPTVKVGPDLSDQVGVVESELPPGGGFRIPHWHEDLYEIFYVLAGEIEYLLDRNWHPAPVGSTVFVPEGAVHAFRNATGRPARQLVIGPPGAIDLLAELGEHPRDQWEEVHERHRSHYAHAQLGGGRADFAAGAVEQAAQSDERG
jgi:quercetin dioxygenase-like cupin family protein